MSTNTGMTWPIAALCMATVLLLSVGQVLFKAASTGWVPHDWRTWCSPVLACALLTYGAATLAWLFVLSRVPLTLAFPFYGLSFVFVPLLAAATLREPLRAAHLAGAVLIVAGIAVATRRA